MRRGIMLLLLLHAMSAAEAGEPLDLRAAGAWFAHYSAALVARDAVTLGALLAGQVPVRVLVAQENGEALQFTLTRDEYLQQTRALWRFAADSRYAWSKPVFAAPEADGSRVMTVTQQEEHRLFGELTRQRSELRVRLAGTADAVQVVAIDARVTSR